ncbi:MAG TPA: hypothetical protein VFY93_08080 [Planctomycetota bacterium]|nr:hypothetical protein [Planctomycetota bacterium]
MRWSVVALVVLLGAACGEPSVQDRIDAIRRSGAHFAHASLPSPERIKELYPDTPDVTRDRGIRDSLLADQDAAALLRAGDAAVPDLVRLLNDPERGTLAAVFLGEIGGKDAAVALLARWRELRGKDQEKHLHLYAGGEIYPLGYTYERVDGRAYGEMIASLCYVGRDVGKEIAKDTAAAMDEGERLQRDGEDLSFKEWREEDDGKLNLTWSAEPVETACEGLKLLAMAGAPEGVDLFVRALRSPVRAFRWEALQQHTYLGVGRDRTIPLVGALLDDPEWRAMAIEAISVVLKEVPAPDASAAEQDKVVARYKRKLQDLGYLAR